MVRVKGSEQRRHAENRVKVDARSEIRCLLETRLVYITAIRYSSLSLAFYSAEQTRETQWIHPLVGQLQRRLHRGCVLPLGILHFN